MPGELAKQEKKLRVFSEAQMFKCCHRSWWAMVPCKSSAVTDLPGAAAAAGHLCARSMTFVVQEALRQTGMCDAELPTIKSCPCAPPAAPASGLALGKGLPPKEKATDENGAESDLESEAPNPDARPAAEGAEMFAWTWKTWGPGEPPLASDGLLSCACRWAAHRAGPQNTEGWSHEGLAEAGASSPHASISSSPAAVVPE